MSVPNAVKKELKAFAENLAMIKSKDEKEVAKELIGKYKTIFKSIKKKLPEEDEEEWHMITLMQLKGAYSDVINQII